MKTFLIYAVFMIPPLILFGQEETKPSTILKDETKNEKGLDNSNENTDNSSDLIKSKNFKFGAGIGFNFNTSKTYNSSLSPDSNKLKIQDLSPFSFVISGTIVYNKTYIYKKVRFNKQGEKETYGDPYSVPGKFSLFASINFGELAPSGGFSFNKKIEGGLGAGLRLTNYFHVGLFGEISNARQLRDFIIDEHKNKQISTVNGDVLNALDQSDNKLFYNKAIFSISLKFIYILGDDGTIPEKKKKNGN